MAFGRILSRLNNSRWDRYLGMTAAITQLPVPTATPHGYTLPICANFAHVRAQRCQEPLCPPNLKLYSGVRPRSKVWCAVVAGVRPQSKVAGDCTLAPDPRAAPRPGAAAWVKIAGSNFRLRAYKDANGQLRARWGAAGSTRGEGLFAGETGEILLFGCYLRIKT